MMRLALRLARKGLGRTSPNPAVGAVVAAGGRVVGTGWHRQAGTEHAEVLALREAGDAARGATLYVTLEPCAHHGRTPPCVEAVLASGVGRVVAAMQDPDPLVAGRGFGALREAGVEVEVGTEGQAAADLNEAYLTHRRLWGVGHGHLRNQRRRCHADLACIFRHPLCARLVEGQPRA